MTKRLISFVLVLVMMALCVCTTVACGGDPKPCVTHVDGNGDGKCDNCSTAMEDPDNGGSGNNGGDDDDDDTGKKKDKNGDGVVDKWDEVDSFADRKGNKLELTMQLSEYSDGEMTSGAKKYLAGPGESSADTVLDLVYKRNYAAEEALGIHMNYVYINKGWSEIKGAIVETEKNGVDTPDLYCDMIYDMMAASIENGVFKNLYRYTTENLYGYSDDYYQGGHFDFQDKYGYYTAYMDDLSLTEDKQFLMASDFYLDVIRALLLLPFNIDLYTSLVNPNDPEASGLYELVREYNWTWDKMKEMCNIYSGGEESMDETLVMAIAHGGLSAVALVYSTELNVYSPVYAADGTQTGYQINPTCSDMTVLFGKIKDLINTNGIYTDDTVLPEKQREGINKCNEKFKNGTVLFATPTMMGALEEDVFQDMTYAMGVLPLPKLYEGSSYSYCSIINGVGKVGALGFHSSNSEAMSAYIQYVTENSLAVLEAYYDDAMKNRYTDDAGSKDMLDLIYASIGSQKTMIIDELLMNRSWATMHPYTWTQLIRQDNFIGHASDIAIQYGSCVPSKNSVLADVYSAWQKADQIVYES